MKPTRLPGSLSPAPVEAQAKPTVFGALVLPPGGVLPADDLGLDETAWRLRIAIQQDPEVAILRMGCAEQQALAALARQRLDDLERSGMQAATHHLARLQVLLGEVLEALSGEGRRARAKAGEVWWRIAPEVDELAVALRAVLNKLESAERQSREQARQARGLAADLAALLNSSDGVLPLLGETESGQLDNRRQSLLTSQLMAGNLAALAESDGIRLETLAGKVRDGVLLHLPGVLVLLGESHPACTPTRRFQICEALEQLMTILRRKPHASATQS